MGDTTVEAKVDHKQAKRDAEAILQSSFSMRAMRVARAYLNAIEKPIEPGRPAIEVGAVVRLKSGGPLMVVTDAEGGENLLCEWFKPDDTPASDTFPVACLDAVEK